LLLVINLFWSMQYTLVSFILLNPRNYSNFFYLS